MRHGSALLLGLCATLLLGCVSSQPSKSTNWLDRLLRPAGPSGPDTVQMDVAFIERPLGDLYLNRDLWVAADEQVIALENKALLDDNGFRIGQVGGIVPVGLQNLLTSERSCANPRRIRIQAGRPTKIVLGPEMAQCRMRRVVNGEPTTVTLEKAQCTLEVEPSLTADGRTRLRFVPQIFHGESAFLPRPTPELTGWILKEERATERYTPLAWEVTLAPNEYVVIGGRYDRAESLGQQCFVRPDEPTPVQRLLVIRTSRAEKELEVPASSSTAETAYIPQLLPLASRAAMATARGSER